MRISGTLKFAIILLILVPVLLILAASKDSTQALDDKGIYFGAPLPGLNSEEETRFQRGLASFSRIWTVDEGLGPSYNAAGCADCHISPLPGGTGVGPNNYVTLFGRSADGTFDPLIDLGGPHLQSKALPDLIAGGLQEKVPPRANCTSERKPPALFGLGLIDVIADEDILIHADLDDLNGDGIRGRPNFANGTLGRFGWKADAATLKDFVARALLLEIGLTNSLYSEEITAQGVPIEELAKRIGHSPDQASDPEVDDVTLNEIVDFVALLDAPPRKSMTGSAKQGEAIFQRIGCAACHVPTLTTSWDPVAARSRKEIHLYSDLLLHDMGQALGDCIQQGEAKPNEFRTPPLWGLRSTGPPYFHDGRARDLTEAIRLHGGEAEQVRQRFLNLTPEEQDWLIEFLNSL